jgi:hypothetical protein
MTFLIYRHTAALDLDIELRIRRETAPESLPARNAGHW